MAKSKQRMEARIIKEHKQQAPVTKADVSVQVTPEDAFNAGDWIMPMNDRIGTVFANGPARCITISRSVSERTRTISLVLVSA